MGKERMRDVFGKSLLILCVLTAIEAARAQVTCLGGNAVGGGIVDLLTHDFQWRTFSKGEEKPGCSTGASGFATPGTFPYYCNTSELMTSRSWASGSGTIAVSGQQVLITGVASAGQGDPIEVDPTIFLPGCIMIVDASGYGGGNCSLRIDSPVRLDFSLAGRASVSAPVTVDQNNRTGSVVIKDVPKTISIGATAHCSAWAAAGEGTPYVPPQPQSFQLIVNITPLNLSTAIVRAIEVTQSIQDWENNVLLVSNKWTFARVFLEGGDPDSVGNKISGKLYAARNGSSLGSPIAPLSGGPFLDPILLGEDLGASRLRGEVTRSHVLTFALPREWAQGTITLSFDSDDAYIRGGEPGVGTDPPNDGKVTVFFVSIPEPTLEVVPLRFRRQGSAAVNRPPVREMVKSVYRSERLLPTRGIKMFLGEPLLMYRPQNYVGPAILEAMGEYYTNNGASPNRFFMAALDPQERPEALGNLLGQANSDPRNFGWATTGYGYYMNFAHEFSHLLSNEHPWDPSYNVVNGDGVPMGRCNEAVNTNLSPFPYFHLIPGSLGVGEIVPTLGPMTDANKMVFGFTWNGNEYSLFSPMEHYDLMSYCQGEMSWISRYTYENAAGALLNMAAGAPIASAGGSKGTLEGPVSGEWVIVRGLVNVVSGSVTWLPFRRYGGSSEAPQPGAYQVDALDGSGVVLSSTPFTVQRPADGDESLAPFRVAIPADTDLASIALRKSGVLLGTVVGTPNAPTVTLHSPNGGEMLDQEAATIHWSATDPDGGVLYYTVEYSRDGGTSWRTLEVDSTETNAVFYASELKGSSNALFRVQASDGFHCTSDESDGFLTISDKAPQVIIVEPASGQSYHGDSPIILQGTSMDPEEGTLQATNLAWSSDRDGYLGTGTSLYKNARTLSEGAHTIRLKARDKLGNESEDSIQITIARQLRPLLKASLQGNSATLLEVVGEVGTLVTIEASSTLTGWQPLGAFPMTNGTIAVPVAANQAKQFFRARSSAMPPSRPQILALSENIQTTNGKPFVLYSTLIGAEPISHQWYHQGVPLAGATNGSLSYGGARGFQSGDYVLIASNALGVVTSSVVQVFVAGPDYQPIHYFGTNSADGINGWGPLALDNEGWLYGCARNGSPSNSGVIFRLRTDGRDYSVLRTLNPAEDGASPGGGVILGSDGVLYGTCSLGGSNNSGTVFRINRDGSGFGVLHHFLSFGDCRNPQSELSEGSDGRLYGTAYSGGGFGPGGLFVIDKTGANYRILYGFKTTGNDGQGPAGGLIEGAGGFLYGTTEFGGISNKGCLFRIAKGGTNYARIRDFGAVAGAPALPCGPLAQHSDGFLYGTTYSGGSSNSGTVFKVAPDGSTFFTLLRNFGLSFTDPTEPFTGVTIDISGNLLGTTRSGGSYDRGVIFKVGTNSASENKVLRNFGAFDDGARARTPLLKGPDGIYYGMTVGGGRSDCGIVFRVIPE